MSTNKHGGKGLGGKDRICLGVNISTAMHNSVLEIAKRDERSISDIVRTAIKDFLAKEMSKE